MSARRHSPACERNREPILAQLRRLFPEQGEVLEVGSGTGQHAAFFAEALPRLRWRPTDREADNRASVAAWTEGLPNVDAPRALDLLAIDWEEPVDAVFNANTIHIAPWAVAQALFPFVGEVLRPGGIFVLYGPFKVGGAHTAPSNEAFEGWLKAQDPDYGVRDLEAVLELAEGAGLTLRERVEMPANNKLLAFHR